MTSDPGSRFLIKTLIKANYKTMKYILTTMSFAYTTDCENLCVAYGGSVHSDLYKKLWLDDPDVNEVSFELFQRNEFKPALRCMKVPSRTELIWI